ncbi:hypothetical protein ABI36_0219175 [Pseudomonas aeruginosa]|uniref:hypothetical protein n=1 Tax=Pseudomonas aeruginosa TaxID=287 RepID=UPI0007338B25|nr:hypothetical protein [Pseudomonas aeruginosa]OHW57296.1 hypothetical protein ABI36_0219175 [Pseudomonas aeruginosa]
MSKQEWEIVKSDFDTYYVRESEGSYIVERVIAEGICSLDKARLIVAAPELLSLAKRWAALDGSTWHPERYEEEKRELLAATNEAIAKATA